MDADDTRSRRPEVDDSTITQYLARITTALVEYGLDWVVEAIDAEIDEGKTVQRTAPLTPSSEGRRSRLSVDTMLTLPLEPADRLLVAMEATRRVLVHPAVMERDLLTALSEAQSGSDTATPAVTVEFTTDQRSEDGVVLQLGADGTAERVEASEALDLVLIAIEEEVFGDR